ncbi:MAG: hypothetical protein ACYDCC_09485 [Actinomycetota bacterium]
MQLPSISNILGYDGTVQDVNNWDYYAVSDYGVTDSNGNYTSIGKVTLGAHIQLNGRTIYWHQTTEELDGPAIQAQHEWNCVDVHSWGNSSCSSDWQAHLDPNFETQEWDTYWNTNLSNNDDYHMDYRYSWWIMTNGNLEGPWHAPDPNVYPYTDRLTSATWHCYASNTACVLP